MAANPQVTEPTELTEPVESAAPGTLSPERMVRLGYGFWDAKVLLSAVELGVFSALARGPLPADRLAGELGVHPRSALDFFDALVSLGMLSRREGRYAN